MTENDQKILEEFAARPNDFNIPDLSPSEADLQKGTPLITAVPTKAVPNPIPESWSTFWQTGIPTVVNSLLTCFGWGLAAQRNAQGEVVNIFPIRTNSRGLGEQDTVIGLEAFSRYMALNAQTLHEESYVMEHHIQQLIEEVQAEEQGTEAEESTQQGPMRRFGTPYELPSIMSESTRNQQLLRQKFAELGIPLDGNVPSSEEIPIEQLSGMGGVIVPPEEAAIFPDGMEPCADIPDDI